MTRKDIILETLNKLVSYFRAETVSLRNENKQLKEDHAAMWSALNDISYINEPCSGRIATQLVFGPGNQHGKLQTPAIQHEPKEICICAAVRTEDGSIFRGQHHCHAIELAIQAGAKRVTQEDQGFITSFNRFVGRKEAARLQNEAGIVSADNGRIINDQLYSEDLY